MKNIYKLTAFDIKSGIFIEEGYYTSKSKAMDSKDNLLEYLIFNHRLGGYLEEVADTPTSSTTIIDNKYKVRVTMHTIRTMVGGYN